MVVVGGAVGVVSSVARRMAARGCNIVLAGRNPERLEEVATETARDAKQRREPLFHLSSPIAGWGGRQPEPIVTTLMRKIFIPSGGRTLSRLKWKPKRKS